MRSLFASLCVLAALPGAVHAQAMTGEEIYKQQCVRCHGATGEGTKKAPQPLLGDRSIPQLATVIDHTMPEDDPDKLDATQSRKVAEFIHAKFYSPAAQARINPPRIELSHLTVGQYRNSIADVVGSFRTNPKLDDREGLRAEYYNSRGFQGNKRLIDRTDPEVTFDFKTAGPESKTPLKEPFDKHQFSIRWEGSVLAPDTGRYEFVVRTDHAIRLWVNDAQQPLIDRWVKSGSDTEFRADVFLIGGHAYPVKLEFSKAKQGVDDSKKNPNPPAKPAFISLLWKRPKGTTEVIPARHLSPLRSPEVCVVSTPFPPDDRSLGWERGTAVTKEWENATTDGAIEAAAYITQRLPELAGLATGGPPMGKGGRPGGKAENRNDKLRAFCRTFAERAFRRPLSDEENRTFIDQQFETASDSEAAAKRVILLVLKSPRFLYPALSGSSDSYAVASRLALAMWDSTPDAELLAAASAGKLADRAEVMRQAERMLRDPRAKTKLREFLFTWLQLDQVHDLSKDAKRFPGFDDTLAADLRTSLELFLDDVVWNKKDFRQLFLSEDAFVNSRLAKFYGVELPAEAGVDAGFTKVKLEPERRSGVITHPYILATLAYNAETSPIHRGVFLARGLLGINIRPPQEAFTPLAADLHPNLTTRERVLLQTKPAACAGCHTVMNPLGFALENFDAVGRYRDKENGKALDVSGSYDTRAGTSVKFKGAKELAKFLAESPEVSDAFAQRLFHHLVKQPVMAYGIDRPAELWNSFSENKFDVGKLMVDAAVMAAMTNRPPK